MKKYYSEKLNAKDEENLLKRPAIDFKSVFEVVRKVLEDVRTNADEALRTYTEKFDGVYLESFTVSEDEINEACGRIPEETKEAFIEAARNIEKFHRSQVTESTPIETTKGVECFRRVVGIEKIGLYIPGGTAPLPSTVLMLGIPAKIAGCKEVIMCTPPNKEGKVPDIILFSARLAGITKIFKIGGAQAIAAMGYGTQSVPKVYKIFGPGNQFVTAAKMIISIEPDGAAMDMPAGPSEVLVIADECANAEFVAADLLSQAEHGVDSQVVLVCTDWEKADEILQEIDRQIAVLPRLEIAKLAISKSFILIVKNVEQALAFSNKYAPEHLILNVKNASEYIGQIENAGSVFIGQYSCESAGDYASGTNHTLPTYGYARAYSGVSVDSFTKKITFQELNKEGVRNLGPTVEKMAEVEQLQAHKNAMTLRLKSLKND